MSEDRSFDLQARLQGLTNFTTLLSLPTSSPPEWPSSQTDAGAGSVRAGRRAKIVIIASELLIRDCLVRCLQGPHGYEIEPFATIDEWIGGHAAQPLPSLILLCAFGRSHDSTEMTRDLTALQASEGKVPIVLLSDVDDVSRMQAAFELGARGYIPTNVPLDVALSALRVIEVGGTFVPASSLLDFRTNSNNASAPRRSLEHRTATLTARQIAVGEAIRQGKANKQIAYELDMRESTVKVHIRNIMKKLNAKNRTDIAVKIQESLHDATRDATND